MAYFRITKSTYNDCYVVRRLMFPWGWDYQTTVLSIQEGEEYIQKWKADSRKKLEYEAKVAEENKKLKRKIYKV